MDFSLLPKDDATQSFPAPADSRTGDSELSLLDSPNKNTLCAHKTETNILTNPSFSESLSVSRLLPQDDSTDSDHLKPSSTSYNMSECFSALKESDFRVRGCFGSSLPRLPDLPQDVISPRAECYSEAYARATSTSQSSGAMSPVSEGLMKSSITELTFSHSSSPEQSPPTLLTWPLSPQPESVERDAVIAPVSDLYIFESDTQDFILKPSVAPQEITCPGYQPFPQTGEKEADGHSSKNVLMCDSADVVVTQYLHDPVKERTMGDDESGMIHNSGHGPPAVDVDAYDVGLMLGSHVRQEKAEVTGLTPQLRRSDSTTEVWQDACQYLAEEDIKDQDVLDKRSHSAMRGGLSATYDLSFLPGNTQVSIYNPEVSDWIGCSSEKTRRPPVERWSSVDSWASALSDWTELITAVPEDITAAFTEIGAEIEALTQALAEVDTPAGPETAVKAQSQTLDVQAQPLEAHVPGSSRFQAPPAEPQGRESSQRESLSESTLTEPEEIQSQAESYQCPTHQHSAMGSADAMVASSQRDGVAVAPTPSPGSKSSGNLDISQFEECVESITNAADPVILIIKEDIDLEEENAQTPTGEPLGDERGEVTHGHRVSQGFGAEQEIQRSRGPVVVNAGGSESSLDLLFLTTDYPTLSSVDRQPSLRIDVSADTLPSLDGARQVEPQSGCPKFITPLAPLSIGSSLICLEGDQPCPKRFLNDNKDLSCDHVQPCVLWPTSDGITDKASLEGDEELIHKKENTAESEGQCKHSVDDSLSFLTEKQIVIEDIHELSRELSNLAPVPAGHFIISEEKRVAFITLELNDPFLFWAPKPRKTDLKFEVDQETAEEMPHKTRSKKDKAGGHHHGAQVSKKPEAPHVSAQHSCNKQDAQPPVADNHTREKAPARLEDRETKLGIESDVAAETTPSKPHVKKKKKQAQNAAAGRAAPLAEVESGVKPNSPKGRIEMFEAKLGATAGKAAKDSNQSDLSGMKSQQPEDKALQGQHPPDCTDQPKSRTSSLMDDVVKRRRLAGDKFGKIVSVLESKVQKTDVSIKAKGDEPKLEAGATRKKAYSEVVKQKIPPAEEPKVVQPIQAAAVNGDPQSLSLWCQFACVFSDYAVTWSRDGRALAEIRRSAGDESRVSLTVSNASHKDLGKYQCRLSSSHGSVALDYLLTYEVLSEIVIPSSPKTISSVLVQVGSEEEDAHCSSLMFKDDFLSDQYFGENHPVSIVTEKAHFGEGMHRRAFRTKLQAGQIPLLVPGHPCVLKVHNSISYGTKNNDELVQKNFSLAVEECQVQNTAREYIKAYTAVAQSTEAFGDVPEIIPIYLIHRPANDVPYATLEEELIGDFVKYSVKDGKEINLLRRDSEAGQKCCAFQHWVYEKTEGNLLVTDMQGVGMRLTDVGIATCKKGYKGFKGNCATSFIDQFKALHQCNRYCEILELKSLQPKAKKPSAPKPKAQASAALKKKTTGPTVRGKT